jgi:hypothetical protein
VEAVPARHAEREAACGDPLHAVGRSHVAAP